MVRQIIHIDEEKCNGCGLCATACHEGAIDIIDGKAKLVRENFCDGFGDCLPGCPTGAITFEEREAPAYDEAAVEAAKAAKDNSREEAAPAAPVFSGCPGSMMRQMSHEGPKDLKAAFGAAVDSLQSNQQAESSAKASSELTNWPPEIKLAPITAPYFDGAKLLIAADCTAFTYGNFHQDFIKGKTCIFGCPKLDAIDYSEKLTEIIRNNDIQSVTIVRMEVPCCGGLEMAAKKALQNSGKFIPWQVVTIGINGEILD